MSYNREKMEEKELGKNQNFQEFIGVSPLQKTLRNELIPTETTKKNIAQLDLLTEDEVRAQNREKLKEMMDDYYRDVIDSTLRGELLIDWSYLFSCMRNHLRENSKSQSGNWNERRILFGHKSMISLLKERILRICLQHRS